MYTENQLITTPLEIGAKISIFSINAFAMCAVRKVTVRGITPEGRYYGREGRKRKDIYLFPKNENFIALNGWDNGILSDTETNCFMGNACYNFVAQSTAQELKKNLTDLALSEITPQIWNRVNYVEADSYHNLDEIIEILEN